MTFQVGADGDANSRITIDIGATALADFTAGTAMAAIDITDSNTLQDRDHRGLHPACRARCGPEPVRAHHQQPQRRGREPVRVGEPDPRHRHGAEMMNFTRSQILSQAGTAMLAQANQAPQGVLSLLR